MIKDKIVILRINYYYTKYPKQISLHVLSYYFLFFFEIQVFKLTTVRILKYIK